MFGVLAKTMGSMTIVIHADANKYSQQQEQLWLQQQVRQEQQ